MVKFIAHWLGVALFAFMNGTFAWILLDWKFDLGYWPWVLMAAVAVQFTRSGILFEQFYADVRQSLTAKRR
jgi:hypothetical protein